MLSKLSISNQIKLDISSHDIEKHISYGQKVELWK